MFIDYLKYSSSCMCKLIQKKGGGKKGGGGGEGGERVGGIQSLIIE